MTECKLKLATFILIVLYIIVLSTVGCTKIHYLDNGESSDINQSDFQKASSVSIESSEMKEGLNLNEYVDEQLQELIQSSTYQNGNIDERYQMVNQLLSKLKKEKAIIDFSYNKDSYLFSFEYCDGVLGGVRIKDFNSDFN